MKTCPVCGEDIAAVSAVCPYCETPQPPGVRLAAGGAGAFRGAAVADLNIEAGLPTVDEALAKLKARLAAAEADGVRLVRVIHGWGSSSGGGGKIRPAVRRWLEAQRAGGRFRSVLPGEGYSHTGPAGRNLIRRFPELSAAERQDRRNPGITFVEL